MPEPITLAIAAAAGPAMNGASNLISALKEPMGKKKIEEMRKEISVALEEITTQLISQDAKCRALEQKIAYLELPFWKRWFVEKPK